jgi:hypothetical protein
MPDPPGGGGGFRNLPKWVWYVGGAVVIAGGYYFYRARKQSQAAAASGTGTGSAYGQPLPGSGMIEPIFPPASYGSLPLTPAPTPSGGSSGGSAPPPSGDGGNNPPVPAAPPSAPPNFAPANMAPGEKVIQTVYDSLNKAWLDLTNLGGVYTSPGEPFYGSYLGYAATTPNPAAERAGRGQFTQIIPLSSGGYTLVDEHGESYTFTATTCKSKGGTAPC